MTNTYLETMAEMINSTLSTMGRTFSITFSEFEKNNVTKKGFIIDGEGIGNCKPVIYIENKLTVAEWVEELTKAYMTHKNIEFDVDTLSKDYILKNVVPAVVSSDNANYLNKLVTRDFLDMTIVYKVLLGLDMNAVSSIALTHDIANSYNISEEELYNASITNIEDNFNVSSIGSLLAELTGINEHCFSGLPMIVISNESCVGGANNMLNRKALDKALEELDTDVMYILPSSIHEFICIDDNFDCVDMLRDMVREVNDTEVSDTDRLTYSVYKYSKAEGLVIAD